MLYPFAFKPILKERIWGGRNLEVLYQKELPPGVPVGESWEISDREGDTSIISNGAFEGESLRWLMENHATQLVGSVLSPRGRFPWLIKILDAQQTLSLQVHPPEGMAARLGGEPKTEMWYVTHSQPGAELFAGLKSGVTRQEFEAKAQSGTVAECFHRIRVKPGDAMFLPSGRVHALGSGLMIFEIQQNSDTTYRVFDWNRKGLDGRPRSLHLAESLQSIDFGDFEPALCPELSEPTGFGRSRILVDDPLFRVECLHVVDGASAFLPAGKMQVLGIVSGTVRIAAPQISIDLQSGRFCLIPASLDGVSLQALTPAVLLQVLPGRSR